MRFRPANQSMINRRFDDRASCLARKSPKQALARKPRIHSPASGNGGHESGDLHQDYRRFPPAADEFVGDNHQCRETRKQRETCKQGETRKQEGKKMQVGMVPTHVQLPLARLAPSKGGERPAVLTPQRGLASWRRTKLRCAAGRLLVAGTPVRGLLLCANHLFVEAMVCLGWRAAHGAGPPQPGTSVRPAALNPCQVGISRPCCC